MQRGQSAVTQLFGVDVKTVNSRLRGLQCPPIGTVFRASAILHGDVLRRSGVNARAITTRLGFSDQRALLRKRRTLEQQRVAGRTGVALLLDLIDRTGKVVPHGLP